MTAVMEGIRILEVAEHTFVPAASAILSDWGAEVIKVEPMGRGDAMRGLARTGVIDLGQGEVRRSAGACQPGQAQHRPRSHEAEGREILYTAGRRLRRLPHQQDARACASQLRSTSTTSAPTTRTSSTCGARATDRKDPTPTAAATTSRATGTALGGVGARRPPRISTRFISQPGAGLRRHDRRDDDRRRHLGGAAPSRAHRRGRTSSMSPCWARECGRSAPASRWPCRPVTPGSSPPPSRLRPSTRSRPATGPRTSAGSICRACKGFTTGPTPAGSSVSKSSLPTRDSPLTKT